MGAAASLAEMVARQRSAEILDLPLGSVLPASGELLAMVVDHIDTLTTKLAEVEAERDTLRALIRKAVDSGSWFELIQEARPVEGGQ
jgi:hypothetical protein